MSTEMKSIHQKWKSNGKPKLISAQARYVMNSYLRKGAKGSRRKEFGRLIKALDAVQAEFGLDDIRKVGVRHIYWFDEQLVEKHSSSLSTRKKYHNMWMRLFERLERTKMPRMPACSM